MTRVEKDGRLIDLPVQYVCGKWEVIFGAEVPVREGTYATLRIRERAIDDWAFKRAIDSNVVVKVLDEGTVLQVALSARDGFSPHLGGHVRMRVDARYWPGEGVSFFPVMLGPPSRESTELDSGRGGLWMCHTGFDKCELVTGEVRVLERNAPAELAHYSTAKTLNHALTMLSEAHEVHRISHTGNVYERIFYQERSGEWFPLSSLRDGVRERAKQAVVAAAWEEIEKVIGWCRLPPMTTRERGRGSRRDQAGDDDV